MDKLYTDLTIHSITYKLASRDVTLSVGGEIPNAKLKITRILRDEANYEFYGKLMYAVYVTGEDKKEFLWRSIPDGLEPVITYDARK